MYPEDGRSAIAAAARAIADLRLGRIDEETTANVGVDRGRDGAQHRSRVVLVRPPRRARTTSASSSSSSRRCSSRRPSPPASPSARSSRGAPELTAATASSESDAARAARRRRRSSGPDSSRRYALIGGGADANVFNERGLAVRQSRQRDDGDPHARRAHRRRRSRARWSRSRSRSSTLRARRSVLRKAACEIPRDSSGARRRIRAGVDDLPSRRLPEHQEPVPCVAKAA